MDPERWQRVQSLFHSVAALPQSEQLAALQKQCGGDAELLDDVRALLEMDRKESLLDLPFEQVVDQVFDNATEIPLAYRKIGPYSIASILGEGGMGTVFLGHRPDLGARAAIKVLRDAWLSPARRERFDLEQRTLAQLDHPNIARLLDADSLPDGTPYFVMEYVDGVPLDEYCQDRKSTIADRLKLFRVVCEAVQFAHRHAVIHRDLKPSNILVRSDGTVKLLDFGIAKHLDVIDAEDLTRTGLRLLTPAYASPEQIRGEQAAIHTDVYSLGVILYKLLTGRLPFDVANRTPAEAAAILAEREPVKPSLVARRVAEHSREEQRIFSASELAWRDLDVLCLTAMHKDIEKRYLSIEALIRDIDHFLRGEPLEAQPDSLTYRLRKFARRNRKSVAATAAALVILFGVTVVFMLRLAAERNAALAEAGRSRRIQQFMLNLFQGGDSDAGPANDLTVATLIDRGEQEARVLDQDPVVQAELYQTLGDIHHKLGRLDRAEILMNMALEKRQTVPGTNAANIAESLVALGLLRVDQAQLDEAERLIRSGLEKSKQALPADHPAIAASTDALGRVLEEKGDYDQAIRLLEEAVRLRSRSNTSEVDLAASLYELANVHFYAGHYQESQALNRRVLEINRKTYGERHPRVAEAFVNLGAIQHELGNYKEAEKLHRQALEINQAFYGGKHYRTASNLTMIARALLFQKDNDQAVDLLREALSIQEEVFGPDHPRVASAMNELGNIAIMRGQLDEAKTRFLRMVDIYRKIYPGGHYLVGIALSNLGSAYMTGNDNRQAEQHFREALAMFAQTLPPDHINIAIARIKLGRTLLRQKQYNAAEQETLAGYKILTNQVNPSVSWLKSARSDLVEVYGSLGQPEKADVFRKELTLMDAQK